MTNLRRVIIEKQKVIEEHQHKLAAIQWLIYGLKDDLLVTDCKNAQLFTKGVDKILEMMK